MATVPNDAAGNGARGGFLLFDDTVLTDPATADFVVVSYSVQGATGFIDSEINVQRWDDYTLSGFTQLVSAMNVARSDEHIWLRLRWINSSTTLNVDTSADGISWRRICTNSSIGLTPTRVGLCAFSAVATPVGNIVCSYDFLRFSTSSAIGDMTLGRVV